MKKQASPHAMNSRRRNVSEDPQTIRRCSSLLNATDELLLKIPIDLVIEIFSRLPLKSIARCRCVSKWWASVLRHPDFTELFFTKSLARPQLYFACQRDDHKAVLFFSTPHPQNLDKDSFSIAVVDHHIAFPFQHFYFIYGSVNGFVCITDERRIKGRETKELVWVICNPSTGQSVTLPKMKTRKRSGKKRYLGYDPIEKRHKVLAMIRQEDRLVDHQVLTLGGNGNMTWRMTECGIQHSLPGCSICINGVLYYTAKASDGDYMIVCFDVRFEKFSFFKAMERAGVLGYPGTLINFNGKLASVRSLSGLYEGGSSIFETWVLEDTEKHEWSNHIYKLPPRWNDVVGEQFLQFVGVTATNEFVMSSFHPSHLFHVYYYNFYTDVITRVEIQGMEAYDRYYLVDTLLNHVEDVKLM